MSRKYIFPDKQFIHIGSVTKAQGLNGEVAIAPLSGQPESFKAYTTLVLVDESGTLSPELVVEKLRIHKGRAIVKFDRVEDRTFAEQLVGMGVLLARKDLPPSEDDEYYWHEITGLTVITDTGRYVGKVVSLFSNGAQDIMVISDEEQEYMVPITDDIVLRQNNEEMIIQPPPGLLEINQGDD
jgi:16S rRNA processing protein RimM